MALAPFLCIWAILREVIDVAPDFSRATGIAHYGWMAAGWPESFPCYSITL